MQDGTADIRRRIDELARRLPEPLAPLAELTFNYWWSWSQAGERVFRALDADAWELAGHDPVRLLQDVPWHALERAAESQDFIEPMRGLLEAFRAELAAPSVDAAGVAFVCTEYAIHRSLPTYAGGLGVLAGDLLKEASDQRIPYVGVGLLYRQGYFRQRLDVSGWQHEQWSVVFPERLPAALVTGSDGDPITVEVNIRERAVTIQIWRVDVGRTRLYLLDSDHPANHPIDRWITSRLYVADRDIRLAQYAVLGIGGMRALEAMGIEPRLIHLNEGHVAFAAAELIRRSITDGTMFPDAVEDVRRRVIFTTHTPVAAGNETFDTSTVTDVVGDLRGIDDLVSLGRDGEGTAFGLTPFALRISGFRNGVSRVHGEVARDMWKHLTLQGEVVAIDHVTNGVHVPTWMAPAMRELLDRHLGEGWMTRAADPDTWMPVDTIPDEELWDVRNRMRADLVAFGRRRAIRDRLARGESLAYVEAADSAFDPERLTVGFARRAATYKRVHLLALDPERALSLLQGPLALQLFLAGKAHPSDDEAKSIVRGMFELRGDPTIAERVAYLEDYDLEMASQLVAGCDLWLNVPRPPFEASGTSGMKVAMNGGLNLSVMDGWWAEAFDGNNGWAIDASVGLDASEQDRLDAGRLYELLENEVIPLFHDRDGNGIPHGWVARIKASLRTNGPAFSASRMLADYSRAAYQPR